MFRFSLSTLLICIFVAAVVLSYCMNLPVETDAGWGARWENGKWVYHSPPTFFWRDSAHENPLTLPNKTEIAWRLAWAEPLALITTLLVIQGVRKIWRSIPHKSKAERSEPSSFMLH